MASVPGRKHRSERFTVQREEIVSVSIEDEAGCVLGGQHERRGVWFPHKGKLAGKVLRDICGRVVGHCCPDAQETHGREHTSGERTFRGDSLSQRWLCLHSRSGCDSWGNQPGQVGWGLRSHYIADQMYLWIINLMLFVIDVVSNFIWLLFMVWAEVIGAFFICFYLIWWSCFASVDYIALVSFFTYTACECKIV